MKKSKMLLSILVMLLAMAMMCSMALATGDVEEPTEPGTEVEEPSEPTPAPAVVIDFVNEVITGVDSTMEYSLNPKATKPTWTEIWGTELDISTRIKNNAEVDIAVRVKAVYDPVTGVMGEPGTAAPLTLPARPAKIDAAVLKFDGRKDILPLKSGQEFKVGLMPWAAATDGVRYAHLTKGGTVTVRTTATNTAFASLPASFKVPAVGKAPNPVYNPTTDLVTGVTDKMEFLIMLAGANYSEFTDDTWVSVKAGVKSLDRATLYATGITEDATLLVRFKATETARVSLHTAIKISKVTAQPAVVAGEVEEGLYIDYNRELLIGFDPATMQYSTAALAVGASEPTAGWTIPKANLIVWLDSDGNMLVNETTKKPITPSTDADKAKYTTPALDLAAAKLIPNYSTAANAVQARDLYVRYKAITTQKEVKNKDGSIKTPYKLGTPASAAVKYTLSMRPATPVKATATVTDGVKFNGAPSTIENVSSMHEYKLSTDTSYTPVGDGETWFAAEAGKTYNIRVAAAEKSEEGDGGDGSFASAVLTFKVAAQPAAPGTTVKYAAASDTIIGVKDTMEWAVQPEKDLDGTYKTNPIYTSVASTLTVINRTELTVNGVSATEGGVILVRFKANADKVASLDREVTVAAAVAAPATVEVDYIAEKLTGLTTTMEYKLSTISNWTTVTTAVANNGLDISKAIGTTEVTYEVRTKATTSAPASAIQEIHLPKRPDTPTFVQAAYSGIAEAITVPSGASTYYEGKLSTAATYALIGSNGMAATPGMTYLVRVEARDGSAFASMPLTVTVAAAPSAPTNLASILTFNTTTKRLEGLNASYQYSLDDKVWSIDSWGSTSIEVEDGATVKVYIRFAGSGTTPPSKSTTFNCTMPPA